MVLLFKNHQDYVCMIWTCTWYIYIYIYILWKYTMIYICTYKHMYIMYVCVCIYIHDTGIFTNSPLNSIYILITPLLYRHVVKIPIIHNGIWLIQIFKIQNQTCPMVKPAFSSPCQSCFIMFHSLAWYPLVNIQKAIENGIFIVDWPMTNGHFP